MRLQLSHICYSVGKTEKDSSDPKKKHVAMLSQAMANVPVESPPLTAAKTLWLEAFSEPNPYDDRCGRMRFAMTLFKVPTFTDAVIAGNKLSESQKK